jgi:hypothetical protein
MNATNYDGSYAAPSSFSAPPVLVFGDCPSSLEKGVSTIEASGHRLGDAVLLPYAKARLERQGSASAVWVELKSDAGQELDRVLNAVSGAVSQGRYGAVVSTPLGLIDPVAALVSEPLIEIVVDGDDAERAAALALAMARAARPERLHDASSDRNAERLRQLSDEVSRIASTLARLSTGPQTPVRSVEPSATAEAPEISADLVRNVIRARRLRTRFFPEEMFADPAWDMLLDLLQAEIAQLRVPVSSLCIAAAVPATTALRWLKTMTEEGMFLRRADPHDGRRVFVELAPRASQALRRYFAEVGQPAVI